MGGVAVLDEILDKLSIDLFEGFFSLAKSSIIR